MTCDKCKIAEAKIVVKHAINGRASFFHFCERCAQEQGLTAGRMILRVPMPDMGIVFPVGQPSKEESLRNQGLEREFEEMIVEPLSEHERTGGSLIEKRLDDLKKEKKKAIKNEDYKSAAELRDRISELEKKISE